MGGLVMKVWQLKKLNKVAIEEGITINYENIVQMKQSDIDFLMKMIELEYFSKLEKVISFIEQNREESNLMSLVNVTDTTKEQIRDYIMKKIGFAKSKEIADSIFKGYNISAVTGFYTFEEWKTYIRNINGEFANDDVLELINNNLSFILNVVPENKREYYIQEMISYTTKERFPASLLEYPEILKYPEVEIEKFLSLLFKGYDIDDIIKLFNTFRERNNNQEKRETTSEIFTKSQLYVINYLKSSYFARNSNSVYPGNIIDLFINTEESNYQDIILLFNEIEVGEHDSLFSKIISTHYEDLVEENIRDYIRKIIRCPHENIREGLINSSLDLWENDIIHNNKKNETNLDTIRIFLKMNFEKDTNSSEVIAFIKKLPDVSILDKMAVIKENSAIIYSKFPGIITEDITKEEVVYYQDMLKNISYLPDEVCKKILMIMNFFVVIKMGFEKRKEVYNLLLNPKNHTSIDYILEVYRKKEIEYLENIVSSSLPQKNDDGNIELMTVAQLLNNNEEINKVLEGFDEKEEITAKTLIRSLAYKNN